MSEVINLSETRTEVEPEYRIVLNVEGATEEDLARGVAAAIAVFEKAGVDPWDGAYASHEMEWGDATQMTLTAQETENGSVYWNAIEVALQAACADLPDTSKKYDFSLVRKGEPPYEPEDYAIEVVRPSTTYGRPTSELGIPKPGKRRKLLGWKWQWE
jgi:hypothetical protein